MLNKFIEWFREGNPNFINSYGDIMHFYDKDADVFHIEEIQDAYEVMKSGEEPESLYFEWRHVR